MPFPGCHKGDKDSKVRTILPVLPLWPQVRGFPRAAAPGLSFSEIHKILVLIPNLAQAERTPLLESAEAQGVRPPQRYSSAQHGAVALGWTLQAEFHELSGCTWVLVHEQNVTVVNFKLDGKFWSS